MKIYKFVFKYIDNVNELCTTLVGEVQCDCAMQWVHDENIESYINWLTKHTRWEHSLKEKVHSTLVSAHGLNTKGFVIKNAVHRKEGEMVNMNAKNGSSEILFRKKYWNEFHMVRFCSGIPKTPLAEHNYKKTSHQIIFELVSGMNDAITLKDVCTIHKPVKDTNVVNVPRHEPMQVANQPTSPTSNQSTQASEVPVQTKMSGGRRRMF